MNDPLSESLLSAYLDGEVTDEERVAIEARLGSSEAQRRELEQMQQDSGMLRSLESKPLPAEFAAEVMQLAERESLIPANESSHPSSRPRHSSNRASAKLWIGGLIATAAIVFVMVSVIGPGRDGEFGDVAARTDAPAASAQKLAMLEPEANVDATVDAASEAADALPSLAGNNAGPTPSNSRVAPVDDSTPIVASSVKRNESGLRFSENDLSNAKVGDIVEALDASEGKIAVVRLTVVDRKAGLESFQLLLQHHKIPAANADDAKDSGSTFDSSSNRLTAVFVETDSEMLTAALEQLQHDIHFQEMQVEEPIQLASLDGNAVARIGWAGLESKNPKTAVTSRPKRQLKKVPIKGIGTKDKEEAKNRDAKDGRAPSKNKDGTKSLAKSDSDKTAPHAPAPAARAAVDPSRSRQFQLSLSRDILGRGGRQANSRPIVRRMAVAAEKSRTPALGGAAKNTKPATRSRKSGHLVKVLFVLVSETPDSKKPTTGSKTKKPDGAA